MTKLNFAISILLLAVVCIVIFFGWGPVMQFRNTNPQVDGYVQPRNIANLVGLVQQSTVSIYCEYGLDGDYDQGTGWAMDIGTSNQREYPTALVTNYHVVENCNKGQGNLFVAALGGNEYPAIIDHWDSKNDLAVIATKLNLKPLELSINVPNPGYWVMALGTADGYEGSISFGNVLNITDSEVLITAAISGGNSGGPLVDNEGKVIGTNSWTATKQQYNGAMSLDSMCESIMKCKASTFWEWTP